MEKISWMGDLVENLERSLQTGSAQDITGAVQNILQASVDNAELQRAVDRLEDGLFDCNADYLAKFLFLLYDKLGVTEMARFYLQSCYEELLQQSVYLPLVNRYISRSPQSFEGNYAEYDGEYRYVFRGDERRYCVHSFSNEIGWNLTLLKTPYGSILLDCGAKSSSGEPVFISKRDLLAFLQVYGVSVESIVGVLISHAHFDHYGSISTLLAIGIPPTRFFLGEKTKEIIKGYSEERKIDNARPIESFFVANQAIQIHAYENGHILGSQLFVIRFDDQTVVYTGDFCLHDQQTVEGLDVFRLQKDEWIGDGVDCLILESTCGNRVSELLPYREAQKILPVLVEKLRNRGYKIFLPAFAVGRSQELTLLLSKKHRLLLDGRSVEMTQLYENLLQKKIADSNVKYAISGDGKADQLEFQNIMIASAEMLSADPVSAKYMEKLFEKNARVAMIRTGHTDSNEEFCGDGILQNWQKRGGLRFDVPLSAHASYAELISLIENLAPRNIVAIHGQGIARKENEEGRDKNRAERQESAPLQNWIEDTCVADSAMRNRWENVVKVGCNVLASGRKLENSASFQNAFRRFVKSLKDDARKEPLLKKMTSFDTLEDLFSFLRDVLEQSGRAGE